MGKILIVDDHPILRLAVRLLLERDGHEVVGEADNGVDGVSLAKELKPSLVLLDIGIPNLDGLEVIARIQTLATPPKILVLSAQEPAYLAHRCMRAGAAGFVFKQEDPAELLAGVRAVLSGYSFFPSQTLNDVRNDVGKSDEATLLSTLTDRELTVLRYLALGYTNKQIAEELLISNKTISSYKIRLLEKLNASSLVSLAELAKRNSLV
ncbi:DNA-binding response regulator, LuxR family [Pseudomonas synxantha]|uniref:response regulator transcription factor n=1 Tax=Pseudomonas synxantha TaxID=47883 RepID=UPI000F5889B5|nr:response regulator transcription factor [Pseudomonas synxantha]AZE72370.1 DNA-binding response regulator, LuxR family [Pseudomonas synxantha]AZE78038.1 DNA-binding response regulator, LuxR family [Pseudomonas synxantha]